VPSEYGLGISRTDRGAADADRCSLGDDVRLTDPITRPINNAVAAADNGADGHTLGNPEADADADADADGDPEADGDAFRDADRSTAVREGRVSEGSGDAGDGFSGVCSSNLGRGWECFGVQHIPAGNGRSRFADGDALRAGHSRPRRRV
jgi:hypothetical protein